jgi:hypothetical protein
MVSSMRVKSNDSIVSIGFNHKRPKIEYMTSHMPFYFTSLKMRITRKKKMAPLLLSVSSVMFKSFMGIKL